jgi:hypothetical protein
MPISLSGSLLITGSITTTGGITISGSILSASYAATSSFSNDFTVLGNLTVFGTQSIQYITSSQLNISDNVITVNVASPGVRFGGLSVFDSGSQSSEATASLFWDSQQNHWIYQRESGSTYDGGMLISGPRNAAGLGNESGTTSCMLLVGQGGDHLTSSMIYHSSTATCIPNALISTSSSLFLSGTNKRISTYAPSCWVGISDYVCNGVGFQFTRPNDDVFAHAIFSFNGTTTNNLAISSRSDLVIATGGGLGGSDERMRISSEGRVGIGACVMNYAKLNVYNNTNDATYNSKIQAIFGNSDYRASDAIQIFGSGTSETQFLNGSTTRPAMISLGGNLATSEAVGVINFFRSDNAATYRSRAQIWSATNTTGCSTTLGGYLVMSTADTGCTNPQERLRITSAGNVGIGTSNTSTEANLFLGNQGSGAANEGGQLVLQKALSCACATHLDNFSDSFRVLVGSDTSSTGVHFLIDHKTRNACFYGSVIQSPVVTYAASVSPPSPYTADLRLSITHSSWGGNNDSGTLYVEYQGRAYGNNQTTTAFGVITYRLDSNGVSITNVSTAGVTLSNVTLSTDTSTNLILRVTFAVAQAVDRASIFARTTNSFVTAISADTV